MLDFRRLILSISLPAVIVLLAWFMQSQSYSLPASIKPIGLFLPYIFIFSGMALAWVFHHSREFHILLISGGTYWVMQNTAVIENGQNFSVYLLYGLLCLLLPVNIGIISVLAERGIINFHGLKRLAIIFLQAMLIYWLSQTDIQLLSQLFQYKFIPSAFSVTTTLPDLAQVLFALSTISLGIYLLKNPGLLLAAKMSVLVCLWFALNIYNPNAVLWFSAIGVILLGAIIVNSKQLAYLDELTNLPSRRALNQYLATLGKNYCIAMVDIDHFKKVNDRYGHDVGDQVLKMLTSHLRRVQGGGRAFRYGGEEFTIVFPGKDVHEAAIYADNLRKTVAGSPFAIRHRRRPQQKPEKPVRRQPVKELKITISIGLAQRSDLLLTTEEVIKVADQNLYKAKKKGRNQVVV